VVSDTIASSMCELLEWDTAFFGVRIGRVRGNRLSDAGAAAALEWATREAVECLYFLADAADAETVRAAERHGFALTDVRLELAATIEAGADARAPSTVRPARADDLARLIRLARTSHRNTRFHVDPHFDRERSDALYALWLERSFSGALADAVLVPDVDGVAAGYITVQQTSAATARIGLIAVEDAARGRGHGAALLAAAQHWCAARGLARLTVVTQGRNASAVRFYERAGFATALIGIWYHRWFSRVSG
jgi:dTDP-4-amino-4,6-dideoxy-D-galactose acyltransferase